MIKNGIKHANLEIWVEDELIYIASLDILAFHKQQLEEQREVA